MSDPRRILLIRLSHLGDVVLALPLFHALREAFPLARIAWLSQPEFSGLLEGMAGLERVLSFGRREGARAWLRLREEVASFAPDLVVDAQGNLKSALAALCSGGARRVGLHRRDWREPLGSLAFDEAAPSAGGAGAHAMERTLALARHATGRALEPEELRTDPALSPAELEAGRAALRRSFPAGGPATIVQVAPRADVRSWPLGHFRSLLAGLAGRGEDVLAISGPAEQTEGRELELALASQPGVRHWIGQRGLRELAALFTAAAEAGGRFVGCDSGPMHLAAACGLPVLVLSGPQSHLRTGPWPEAQPVPREGAAGPALPVEGDTGPAPPRPSHRVLRASPEPACAPCLRRRCNHPGGTVCMRDIAPELVLAALPPLAPATAPPDPASAPASAPALTSAFAPRSTRAQR